MSFMSAVIDLLEHDVAAGLAYVFTMIHVENKMRTAFWAGRFDILVIFYTLRKESDLCFHSHGHHRLHLLASVITLLNPKCSGVLCSISILLSESAGNFVKIISL